jgi:hypothetical protein
MCHIQQNLLSVLAPCTKMSLQLYMDYKVSFVTHTPRYRQAHILQKTFIYYTREK